MTPATLLRLVPAAIIAILLILCLEQRTTIARMGGKLQHAADVMDLTRERIGHAQAAAEAADRRHAMDVAAQQDLISKDVADDLETKLDAARAAAAAHARADRLRERSEAASGGVGQPYLSTVPEPSGEPDAADQTAELDDRACGEAVIMAEGLQDWIRRQMAVPR